MSKITGKLVIAQCTLPFSYWPAHSLYLLYRLLSSDERTLLCFKNKLIYQIVDWSQRGWEKWICSRKKKLFFHHHHLFFSVPCLLHTFLFSFSLTACQWGIFSVSLAFLLNRTIPCKASLAVCHFISGESVCFLMSEWKKRQIWLQTTSKSPTHSTWNVGHLSFCSLFKTWDDYHMLNPHGLGGWAPGQISCHCYSQRIQKCAHFVITPKPLYVTKSLLNLYVG